MKKSHTMRRSGRITVLPEWHDETMKSSIHTASYTMIFQFSPSLRVTGREMLSFMSNRSILYIDKGLKALEFCSFFIVSGRILLLLLRE